MKCPVRFYLVNVILPVASIVLASASSLAVSHDMPNRFPCHGRFVNEKNNLNHQQIQAFGEIPGVSAPGGDI